jgi:hypothetical protein
MYEQCDQLHLQQIKIYNHVGYDNQTPFIKFDILECDNDDA